jgi:2-polyprenyl-6-methoxyphenol hydroxylase-like FAD-dependent oxidoreductase
MSDTSVQDNDCDVFVIGGGPAGSTIATLLAKRGLDVVLAEKDTHPRFHIGESLLPLNLELFEQLGVLEQVREIGLRKPGVEFNSPAHDRAVTLNFSEAWDKTYTHAYQVRRADFDKILFDNCIRSGARAMQECRVSQVSFPVGDSVSITTSDAGGEKQWQARYLVDASGRDTFLGSRFAIKRRRPRRCMVTSKPRAVCPATRKATSACSGSSMAGSGLFRCATEQPASVPCARPNIYEHAAAIRATFCCKRSRFALS